MNFLIDAFEVENPDFDKELFMRACGEEVEVKHE
jgi:hypothetical protein